MERKKGDQIILKVYLDNTEERATEVPVTPDSTCADVIECCKEPGEEHCHLAELWRGCERAIAADERPYEILQQWGVHRDEVLFFLRHQVAGTQYQTQEGRRLPKKNGLVEGSHPHSSMLPTGVDLTLSELQEMASRQQQQIDTQQQILVAKEQRLKFLKQQEMRHHQIASENERLRKLREKVEAQELKLKKLRALRGQVDQHKSNNANFTSELEAIRGLFNEKEKELAVAVAKVEDLTRQLETLQKGSMQDNNILNSPAMMELEKLHKELAMRNKLNEQQNTKLNSSRQVLAMKKEEVAVMDKRIAELQGRLQKKRAMQNEHRNNLANQKRMTGSISPHRSQGSNIAAVEPYIKHAPKDITKDDLYSNQDLKAGFSLGKNDPKYQTLPYNTKFPVGDVGKKQEQVNGNDAYPAEKKSDFDKTGNNNKLHSPNNNTQQVMNKELKQNVSAVISSVDQQVTVNTAVIPKSAPQDSQNKNRYGFTVKAPTCFANYAPRPFGSTYSTALITNRNNPITTTSNTEAVATQHSDSDGQLPKVVVSEKRATGQSAAHVVLPEAGDGGLSIQTSLQQPLMVFTTGTGTVIAEPVSPQIRMSSKGSPPVYKVSSRPTPMIQPQQTEVPVSPPQSPNTNNTSVSERATVTPPRIGPMTSTPLTQEQQIITPQTTFTDTPKSSNVDSRPLPGQFAVTSSTRVSLSERQTTEAEPVVDPAQNSSAEIQSEPMKVPSSGNLDQAPVLQNQSDGKDSVDTSPNAVSSALSVLMGSSTSAPASKPSYRYAPKSVIANTYMRKMGSGAIDQYRKNMAALYKDFYPHGDSLISSEKNSSSGDLLSYPEQPNNTPVSSPSPAKPDALHSQPGVTESGAAPTRPDPPPYPGTTRNLSPHKAAPPPYPGYRTTVPHPVRRKLSADEGDEAQVAGNGSEQDKSTEQGIVSRVSPPRDGSPVKDGKIGVVMRVKKTNLKSKDSARTGSRRVSFDPLALLLDASLEGELELVKRTAAEVPNPSAANDEGITALHNAICAGHYDIVKFLVEFGCDANAPDSDGWTPLHCAASCNNLPMVKFLVEHGACIFATTISDQETAAEKCEEDEDGYDGCSEYLYSVQEKLGILNNGLVYALFDYAAENSDELEFHINDELTVLRKGDDHERDWWWTRHRDREGYIPRNLLGLYPRVLPKREET